LKKFRETVIRAIPDARRNPFESEEKFLTYLSDNIGKAETEAKNILSSENKARLDAIGRLLQEFKNSPVEFESNLKDKSDDEFVELFNQEPAPIEQSRSTGNMNLQSKTTDALAGIAKNIENQRESKHREEISEKAYETREGLYSIFASNFLTQYIKDRRKESPHPNTFSEMVLDEHRGGYVIYQVGYLACIGVLVFGILCPIYLLLRSLPPFAASVEPLTEQAKKLLSRDGIAATGAAPEIAKTLALSVAALGIGAAVVIANNPVTAPKNNGDVVAAGSTDDVYPPIKIGTGASPSPPPRPSPQISPTPPVEVTPTPSPEITSTPEINVYPTFRQTFTGDTRRLSQLERDYGSLKTTIDHTLPLKLERGALSNLVTRDDFTLVSKAVDGLTTVPGEVGKLTSRLDELTIKEIPGVRKEFSDKSAELSNRLDATNTAITAFREGTQGPSIGKRASELLGRERYQVTPESVKVLRNLMCRKTDCSSATPAPETCCIAPSAQLILDRLEGLTDQAPMRKNTLLERLGISRRGGAAPSRWETLVLRYSRVSF
jgi:hypothetical protein